ncbi:DUF6518 family protein [Streptosporangium saharense]|uniref:DUF6518 family protein n=1 Tax=Streptosporangium saharense TaxID=1706840 RepID=UPI0036A2FB6C
MGSRFGPVAKLSGSWASALLAGLGLGVVTNLAQGWLPGAWNQVANSGAVWCVPAFVAGALIAGWASARSAATAGLCASIGLVIGYYGYAEFGRDGMGSLTYPLIWLAMAVISGPLFGVAGLWWRNGRTVRHRVIGLAALGGVFGMESILYAFVLHYAPQAWACLAVLILAPLLMTRRRGERTRTLLTALALAALAYVVIGLPLQYVTT